MGIRVFREAPQEPTPSHGGVFGSMFTGGLYGAAQHGQMQGNITSWMSAVSPYWRQPSPRPSTSSATASSLPTALTQQLVDMSANSAQASGFVTPPARTPPEDNHAEVDRREDDRRAVSEAAAVPVPDSPRVEHPRAAGAGDAAPANRATNEEHCIICLEQRVNAKLVPCEHAHFCQDCAAIIVAGAV
eukprot:2469959-Pyramimonas_sp.AAC.1